jgi:hypothetical protein
VDEIQASGEVRIDESDVPFQPLGVLNNLLSSQFMAGS